jgi:cellulose biosynthesis protein BcsQ
MLAVIELTGVVGAGKTLIAQLLGDELAPASILFIDASPDQRLTHVLSPDPPTLTLGSLFESHPEAIKSREAIDWVFSDLTVPAGEENEILTVGDLPEAINLIEQEKLRYGLSRLIEPYDYLIVDGVHPIIHPLLPKDSLYTLTILTPNDWQQWKESKLEPDVQTPALILNQYQQEPFPPALDHALLQDKIHLIGKLPRYSSPEECASRAASDFEDCMRRLNVPLHPI